MMYLQRFNVLSKLLWHYSCQQNWTYEHGMTYEYIDSKSYAGQVNANTNEEISKIDLKSSLST